MLAASLSQIGALIRSAAWLRAGRMLHFNDKSETRIFLFVGMQTRYEQGPDVVHGLFSPQKEEDGENVLKLANGNGSLHIKSSKSIISSKSFKVQVWMSGLEKTLLVHAFRST